MNEIFDKLEKEYKPRVKQAVVSTTPKFNIKNKEIIQEMYGRCDEIEHLHITANGPIETWPFKHLSKLYIFQIRGACDVLSGDTFPKQLESMSYTEVIFDTSAEILSPAMIRELLSRCRKSRTDPEDTTNDAFCGVSDSEMTRKVIEAMIGRGSDFHKAKDIAYVAHQDDENIIDFAGRRIRLQVFDNQQFPTAANDWKAIVLIAQKYIRYDWSGSIFERSAETVIHLEIWHLTESEILDTLSTAVIYFEVCSMRRSLVHYENLRLLVLSAAYTVIDATVEKEIQSKMITLSTSIKRILVIALVNTEFVIQSHDYCPNRWHSFSNSVMIGCCRKESLGDLAMPQWMRNAIFPPSELVKK